MNSLVIQNQYYLNLIFEILKDLRNEEDRLQAFDMMQSTSIFDAKHIKFIVNEGYNSFIAIQHIKLDIQKNNRSEREREY